MGLTLLTPPTAEAVTLTEAKAHLRITSSSQDTYIGGLVSSAARYVENYVRRSFTERQWKLTLDAFADAIELPMGPVQSIDALEYIDADGETVEIDAENFTFDSASEPQWLVRNEAYTWPSPLDAVNVVSITYTAGTETLPAQYADLKQAIYVLLTDFYDNAGVMTQAAKNAVESLCSPYRVPTLR